MVREYRPHEFLVGLPASVRPGWHALARLLFGSLVTP